MQVDFITTDRALVSAAIASIRKALERAASAARAVGHPATPYEGDLGQLDRFEKRYKAAHNGDGPTAYVGALDVPGPECAVMRQGVLILLERHQKTEGILQEELDLVDNQLMTRLGDMRDLGLRFGGQPSLFASAESNEKASMAAEMGLPGASVGVPDVVKGTKWSRTHKPAKGKSIGQKTKAAKKPAKPAKPTPPAVQ